MSQQTIAFLDEKSDSGPLEPVLEINEQASELFDRPHEEGEFEEISPRIFTLKCVKEPLTLPSLNNAIYELGVIDLCWPEITEPVFETRTCFPPSYYTNSTKERLLLAYAENFRRQYMFHYKFKRPLLFQAPNECGLQKMVCTTIRPTKLCFPNTNTWHGVASLVSDFFDYEPLTKPMLLASGQHLTTTQSHMMVGRDMIGCSMHKGTVAIRYIGAAEVLKISEHALYRLDNRGVFNSDICEYPDCPDISGGDCT